MNLSRASFAALLLACAAPAPGQSIQDPGISRERQLERPERPIRPARASSAREHCKAERGVDCETPQGLREWELLERSRAEAVRDGSRHLPARKSDETRR